MSAAEEARFGNLPSIALLLNVLNVLNAAFEDTLSSENGTQLMSTCPNDTPSIAATPAPKSTASLQTRNGSNENIEDDVDIPDDDCQAYWA